VRRCVALVALLAVTSVTPAAAQYGDDDPALEDQRRRDEAYQRRLAEEQERHAAESDVEPDDPARAFLEAAERLVRDKSYRSARTNLVWVQADDVRIDLDGVVARVESFRRWFDAFWSGRIELRPYDAPSRIFLFRSFAKFSELHGGAWRRSWLRPAGHYGTGTDAIVMHTGDDGPAGPEATLVHEVAHQLVTHRLYGGAPAVPWIAEGLATYFGETATDADGSFLPGKVGAPRRPLVRDGPRPRSEAGAKLDVLNAAFDDREATESPLVERLVRIDDPAVFYGPGVLVHYAASWMLVHWLLDGDDGAHAAAFLAYLERDRAGDGGPDALLEAIGVSGAELDARVRAHARSIRVR